MVTRIIHQMWFDLNDYNNTGPPSKYNDYIQKWKELNTEMEYKFWNGQKILDLWNHPGLSKWKNFFNSLNRHIEKCDFSRYAILYIYGGVYIDLDFIPLKSINSLIHNREFGWCYEPFIHQDSFDEGHARISNGFLCSVKEHYIWPLLMDEIMKHYNPNGNVLLNTGTSRISKFTREYDVPKEYFIDTCLIIPVDVNGNSMCHNYLENAYCYTKWNEGTKWWNQKDLNSSNSFLEVNKNLQNNNKRTNMIFLFILIFLIILLFIYLFIKI